MPKLILILACLLFFSTPAGAVTIDDARIITDTTETLEEILNAVNNGEGPCKSGGSWTSCTAGTGAPSGATYITEASEAALSAEIALDTKARGFVMNSPVGTLSIFTGHDCAPNVFQTIAADGTVTCAAGGGGASALDDLSDVTLTTPATGAVLVKSAGDWVDGQLDLADSDAVTGLLPDANIAATIARDSEIDTDIDTHAAIAGAHHTKTTSASELSSGTIPQLRVGDGHILQLAELSPDLCGSGQILERGGSVWGCITTPAGGTSHDILSTTHDDTVTASAVAGDLLYADATPEWNRLAAGTQNYVLKMGASLPAWGQVDIDEVTGQAAWSSTVVKDTAGIIFNGVDADFHSGAGDAFPRLLNDASPDALDCDAAGEYGRLSFDSDLDTDGSVVVCTSSGWKDVDDDGGAGGALNDLSDVTLTSPATGATLIKSAGDWVDGQLDLADSDAVTGVLPTGNVATTLASKTLTAPTIGSTDWTNATHAHAAANSGGQIPLANTTVSGLTAGQVIRATAATTFAWGALDLADTDAVTGLLDSDNLATDVTTRKAGHIVLLDPVDTDFVVLRMPPWTGVVTQIDCEAYDGASVTIKICEGEDYADDTCTNNLLGLAADTLACTTSGATDSALNATYDNFTARDKFSVVITAVSGSVKELEVYFTATID
jgi:hypothetical protein